MDLKKIDVIVKEAKQQMISFIKEFLATYGNVHSISGFPAVLSFASDVGDECLVYQENVNIMSVCNTPDSKENVCVTYNVPDFGKYEEDLEEMPIENICGVANALVAFIEGGETEECSMEVELPDWPDRYLIVGARFFGASTPENGPKDEACEGLHRFDIHEVDNSLVIKAHAAEIGDNFYGELYVIDTDADILNRWIENQGGVKIISEIE